MLKQLSVIGCATAAALLLGACGGQPAEPEQAPAPQADASFMSGEKMPAPDGFDPLGTGKVLSGSISVTATDAKDLKPDYAIAEGTAYFDLGDLQPLDEETTVNVYVHHGGVSMILPKQVPVELECEGQCESKRYNPDASGAQLRMKLQVTGGGVEIAELDAGQ